jgi:hypothetical protein
MNFSEIVSTLSGWVERPLFVCVWQPACISRSGHAFCRCATFWMWAIAFFDAATGYVETALAQVKEKIDGNYRGSPAYYILHGIRNKAFAFAFAWVTIISLGLLLPGVQSNTICDAFQHSFGIDLRVTAGVIVFLLALIIYGGVRRMARISEIVMPVMTIGYVVGVGGHSDTEFSRNTCCLYADYKKRFWTGTDVWRNGRRCHQYGGEVGYFR